MEKKKLYDIVGIACGIILLLILIVSHVQANNSQKLDLPSDAQTLTASADGKVGPVEVEVIASPTEIFKVSVTNHTETDGIGTNAVEQLPGAIIEAQSLAVDSGLRTNIASSRFLSILVALTFPCAHPQTVAVSIAGKGASKERIGVPSDAVRLNRTGIAGSLISKGSWVSV